MLKKGALGDKKGQNPLKSQGNGVFWWYLKPKKHKQARTKPSEPKQKHRSNLGTQKKGVLEQQQSTTINHKSNKK